jgi:hypothetical protein
MKSRTGRSALATILGVVVAIIVFAVIETTLRSPAPKADPKPSIVVTSWTLAKGTYGSEITGRAVNISDTGASYVQLDWSIYDASGSKIGTAMTNISNLAAKEGWNFSAGVLEDGATEAKFDGVTAY